MPWPLLPTLIAAAVRLLVAWRTLVPDRDGVTYLWLAGQAADGSWSTLFDTVFHPVYPALVAAVSWLDPSLDLMRIGQMIAATGSVLAVAPLYALGRRVCGEESARWGVVFYAVGPYFARFPADCLSEGVFYALVAGSVCCLLASGTGKALAAGGLAALAYGTRPEGAALAIALPWLLLQSRRREAFAFVAGGSLSLCLPLGWSLWGAGFTLTPKAAFAYREGVGSGGLGSVLEQVLLLPGALLEGIGWMVLPLAVFGVWLARPRRVSDPQVLLLAPLLLQCLVLPFFKSHYRFVSGFGILVLPFAGLAMVAVLRRARATAPHWPAIWIALVLAVDIVRLPPLRGADRIFAVDLGRYLEPRLEGSEALVTDLPRVAFYAGVRPPPPRRLERAELLAACRSPRTRWVVVVPGRSQVSEEDLRGLGFEAVALPSALRDSVKERGALVYSRE